MRPVPTTKRCPLALMRWAERQLKALKECEQANYRALNDALGNWRRKPGLQQASARINEEAVKFQRLRDRYEQQARAAGLIT